MNSIIFVTKNNNNFYKLELSKTLLHFIEYDFTYFWEQCIDLGKTSRTVGGYASKQLSIIKNLITKCHPFYEAQINSDFEYVVLDCIIEYICRSESIGLEELWARCISPKNLYEKSIFSRISEYKINRAINQWANIMRVQEYAKIKLAYIFDGEPASKNTYKARKSYFDLTFSVAAKELGFPSGELPSVKYYSPALIPNAPFMISKVSKGILRSISDIVDNADEPSYNKVNDCIRDQIGLDAFSYIKNISRPAEIELAVASDAFQSLSDEVYMPDSFKSIIDLEFDKMLEADVFMQKCEKCGKYFVQEMNYKGKFCNRVNASGMTCREQYESEKEPENALTEALDARCQRIYNNMSDRVGDEFHENEFKEWSQYLYNMIENVKNEYTTADDLEAFLDYSEKMCGEVKKAATENSGYSIINEPQPLTQKTYLSEPQKYRFPTLDELDNK